MISAVILTVPNSITLHKTIESIGWVDDIVVIYDGKNNVLPSVPTIRIYERLLNGDFASQRNFGLAKAKGDWVLFVDDDEVISKDLASEIRKQVQDDTKQGYYIKRLDHMWGKVLRYGETGNIRLLRLAKKNSGMWKNPVHEVWEINGETRELRNPLFHFPHSTIYHFLSNINMYSTLRAKILYEQKTQEPWWYIVFYPLGKFMQNYFLRLGFLDRMPGALVALMMSFHSYLVRAKLWHHWHMHQH